MHDINKGTDKMISERKGLNISAAWMPGSQQIALTLTTSGNPDIYLINPDSGTSKRLTKNWGIDVSPSF